MKKSISKVDSIFGTMKCIEDDLITKQIKRFGNHTRPEFAFATAIIQKHFKIFDLGSHIGTFALTAAQKLGRDGTVLCVEGNPETYELLEHNIQLSSQAKILSHKGFVGIGNGYKYIEVNRNTGAGYLVESPSDDIRTISIDDLVTTYFSPDYIKIDVEGFEELVIRHSEYIPLNKPLIYVEMNDEALQRNGGSPESLMNYLSGLGYEFYWNSADRNAANDLFRVNKWDPQNGATRLFDMLCVSADSVYLKPLDDCASISG